MRKSFMVVTTKDCCACRQTKPRSAYHRDRNAHDGTSLDPRCRDCRKKASANHVIDMELRNSGHYMRLYGITANQYRTMHAEQNGLCAICQQPETLTRRGKLCNLCVDHDHITGQVRGLLCSSCNFALGKMQDSPQLLRAAADYLERA